MHTKTHQPQNKRDGNSSLQYSSLLALEHGGGDDCDDADDDMFIHNTHKTMSNR